VHRSGWCEIKYWNAGMIGVAKSWINTPWLSVHIRRTMNPISESRNNRNGRMLTQYSMGDYLDKPDVESNIGTPGMIGVAEGWLNTQCVSEQISLTRSPILDFRNNRSGRRLTWYSMYECVDPVDEESNIGI
jgi:hypothetical protein